MAILKEHITHMDKDQLNSHQSELTTFFLSALDFRAQHCQVATQFQNGAHYDITVQYVLSVSFWTLPVIKCAYGK